MEIQRLKREAQRLGLKFFSMVFLEDGYSVRMKYTPPEDCEDEAGAIAQNFERLDRFTYKGLALIDSAIVGDMYEFTLVPTSYDEIKDFIWKYVERYGRRDDYMCDVVNDAVGVVEHAINRIPCAMLETRAEAFKNFERLTDTII